MVSAVVNTTAGTIAVTYNEAVTCPTAANLQLDFVYSNGGALAYPSTCAGSPGTTVTFGTFFTTATGAVAATLVTPVSTDTLKYTEPTTDSTTVSVYSATNFPEYALSQALPFSDLTTIPIMVSAVVVTGTITVTYNVPVSCPATGADADFVYDSAVLPAVVVGGVVTGCASGTGDTLVLSASGGFNAPAGTARIVYTQAAPALTNAVYATGTTTGFASSPQTIAGTAIS